MNRPVEIDKVMRPENAIMYKLIESTMDAVGKMQGASNRLPREHGARIMELTTQLMKALMAANRDLFERKARL